MNAEAMCNYISKWIPKEVLDTMNNHSIYMLVEVAEKYENEALEKASTDWNSAIPQAYPIEKIIDYLKSAGEKNSLYHSLKDRGMAGMATASDGGEYIEPGTVKTTDYPVEYKGEPAAGAAPKSRAYGNLFNTDMNKTTNDYNK